MGRTVNCYSPARDSLGSSHLPYCRAFPGRAAAVSRWPPGSSEPVVLQRSSTRSSSDVVGAVERNLSEASAERDPRARGTQREYGSPQDVANTLLRARRID